MKDDLNSLPSSIAKLITEDPSVINEGFQHESDIKIDELTSPEFGDMMIDVIATISYDIIPGEERVMYYPDGSGHPGSDGYIEWEVSNIVGATSYDEMGNQFNIELTPENKMKIAQAIRDQYDDERMGDMLPSTDDRDDDEWESRRDYGR